MLFFILFHLLSCSSYYRNTYRKTNRDFHQAQLSLAPYLDDQSLDVSLSELNIYCPVKNDLQYIDFDQVGKKYYLNPLDLRIFQWVFNTQISLESTIESSNKIKVIQSLSDRDKELVFYDSLEKVKSKLDGFKLPKHHRVILVWIDPLHAQKNVASEIEKMLKSDRFQKSEPILLSACMKGNDVLEKFHQLNHAIFSAELMSRFVPQAYGEQKNNRLIFNLDILLKDKAKVELMVPKFFKNKEEFIKTIFKGEYSFIYY